ncbi:hypothetical protein HYH02_002131 [Chlamydomonas schloesseri]|uniref:Uncharacterized protein n=1 Tax=Chlamydomonas schloesseri TaxID=2026947 RepID=A0A835WTI1_9CHLO|nr:hypothetical protein HYH02_002131 [Chlamydomonas schloesseri]|eukprot:KAG2453928.1 hypothetical protein HYH02_002131 [Chlamydomonas schloesseri]
MAVVNDEFSRSLQSAGTDGRSASTPGSRGASRERRALSSRESSDVPRYFMQIGQDIKRNRAYQIIQELQLMVCSRDNGIRGNAARARTMVLLKEVQGVLIGLENKIDSQTFDLGVLNVERTELRKELRDEKAKEQVPFHTIDFRTTEVRELPHKLRTLFEDNQLLREQVRSLQYAVRSAEGRLEAAERKAAALELDNAHLAVALRDAGSSPDMAAAMRQQQEEARTAQARVAQLEQQVVALLQQLDADRALATQQAQRAAARQAALEAKLGVALGRAAATRLDAAGGGGGSGWMDGEGEEENWGRGGTVGRDGSPGRQRSPAGFQRTYATGGPGQPSQQQRRGTSGRDRSPSSPPRSPTGRSISHSPGSTIPSLYPSYNTKPRAPRGFTADSPTWNGGSSGAGAAGGGGGGSGGGPHLPNLAPASPSAAAAVPARPPSTGGGGGLYGGGGLEVLQEGRAGSHTSSHGTATGPGEQVRAINSSAVLTSRPLLPQVSGGSANGGSSSHGGGGSATGMRQSSHMSGGLGILGLPVSGSMRRASGSSIQGGAGGGGGGTPSGAAAVAGGGGMQVLSSEPSGARPPVSRSASNASAAAAAAAGVAAPAGGSVAGGSEKGSTSGAAAAMTGGAEEPAAPVAEEVAGA